MDRDSIPIFRDVERETCHEEEEDLVLRTNFDALDVCYMSGALVGDQFLLQKFTLSR